MNSRRVFLSQLLGAGIASAAHGAVAKKRLFVVSSYDRDYLWSQSTQEGLVAAMLKFGYLDSAAQGGLFSRTDQIESSKTVIRKMWMDSKRASSQPAIAAATHRIMQAMREFRPDLVMLGDDNAAHYIGNQLLDSTTPVVFWGLNGLPLKYGLVDSMDQPGHNVTGVWQQGYFKESLELLQKLVPSARTFGILGCDSETSRPWAKQLQNLAREGKLPLQLVDTLLTNSFEDFKTRSMALAGKVDAFFVLNHDTMVDARGQHVNVLVVGKWYLENIKKPETSAEDQFVREGMLSTANDYGYNQSYMAFEMANEILEQGLNPAHMRPRTPARGPLMVNTLRAQALGIRLSDEMRRTVQMIDTAAALKK